MNTCLICKSPILDEQNLCRKCTSKVLTPRQSIYIYAVNALSAIGLSGIVVFMFLALAAFILLMWRMVLLLWRW